MASKENLRKRIESWHAKLEKEIEKLEMYDKRRDNALLRLSKAVGTNVTLDTYKDYARSNWDLYYSVDSAIDSKEDVKHRIESIKQDIANLQYKLDAISLSIFNLVFLINSTINSQVLLALSLTISKSAISSILG